MTRPSDVPEVPVTQEDEPKGRGVRWLQRERVRPECDCPKAGPYACPHCDRAIAATAHVNECHAAAVPAVPSSPVVGWAEQAKARREDPERLTLDDLVRYEGRVERGIEYVGPQTIDLMLRRLLGEVGRLRSTEAALEVAVKENAELKRAIREAHDAHMSERPLRAQGRLWEALLTFDPVGAALEVSE